MLPRTGAWGLSSAVLAFLLMLGPAEAVAGASREYLFFRAAFERVNGPDQERRMDEAFDLIAGAVARIQGFAPRVSLGGMLSLVIYESGARLGFFNTKDDENSFHPGKPTRNVPKLDGNRPFAEQPLARYSYQFGLISVHTSIFRPCVAGAQLARKQFDALMRGGRFAVTDEQLAGIRHEFGEVCRKALKPVADQPRSVDYYILNAHRLFGVPLNRQDGDPTRLDDYPLYAPRVTVHFFFAGILAGRKTVVDDRSAICAWGGGDPRYCEKPRQDAILGRWDTSSGRSAKASP